VPAVTLPHSILERARWWKALRYAQTLYPGAEVVDSIDGPYIETFRALLPAALRAHGLRLDGQTVRVLDELPDEGPQTKETRP
jgi:hypothetical protein